MNSRQFIDEILSELIDKETAEECRSFLAGVVFAMARPIVVHDQAVDQVVHDQAVVPGR